MIDKISVVSASLVAIKKIESIMDFPILMSNQILRSHDTTMFCAFVVEFWAGFWFRFRLKNDKFWNIILFS